MSRKKLFIANWKLNHHRESARDFFAALKGQLGASRSLELAVAPVAPMLEYVAVCIEQLPIAIAAQNVFFAAKGAFTGEWAALHLKELGVRFCLVGHSERRNLFFETDEVVGKKAQACFEVNIDPVICVGETWAEREAGCTEAVIERQLEAIFSFANDANKRPLIFAYEPIWAIGTGKNASPKQVEEVHHFIRELLHKSIGEGLAEQSRILYGGSVNAQNISEIAANPNVDGALVGGASLQAESFLSMVNALHDMQKAHRSF